MLIVKKWQSKWVNATSRDGQVATYDCDSQVFFYLV